MSLPMRGAWIEITLLAMLLLIVASLPMRGAWIEIRECGAESFGLHVAPHAGSVD